MEFNNDPLHILIIEDNPGDAELLSEVLQETTLSLGEIRQESTLHAAFDTLINYPADIIFLDLSLPDVSGLETFETIQARVHNIPIVILTGLNDTRLALDAINKGAQDFLIKGDLDANVLTKTILYSIERKRILESLRLSSERYDLASKATNDMIWDWDLLNNKVYRGESGWNKLFANLPNEEIIFPDSWWDRIHPDDKEHVTSTIQKVLNTSDLNNFEIECRIDTGDGTYAYVIDRGYAIRNEKGEAIRLIGATQNVTEKKEAEEELKRLSLVAKETSNAVVITDKDCNVQWINESFEKTTGYKVDEVLHRNLYEFFERVAADPLGLRFLRLKLHQKAFAEYDLRINGSKGDMRWLRIQCQPQLTNNQVTSFFAIISDITNEKESELKLINSERRFRSIIENSSEGLALIDTNGQTLDLSRAALKILGYSNTEIKWNTEELIFKEDRDAVQNLFNTVCQQPNSVKSLECRVRHVNGKFIWIEATFHNLLHEEAINAVVVHFRDISTRKLFEDVLKSSEEKYRHLFNSNPGAIFIWDPVNFHVIEVNDAALTEYGYSRNDFKRLSLLDIVVPEQIVKFTRMAQQIAADKHFLSTGIWHHRAVNGIIKYMDITFQAIDYYGKNACLAIATNISEKLELEKKLAEERLRTQQEITEAVIIAQEHEREDLGKELHDNINQILATTKLYIEYALTNDEMRNTLLHSAKDFISSAVDELRKLSKSLLPPSLGEVGLIMALNELVESIQKVNKFQLHTAWHCVNEAEIPEQLKLTVFRIVQEQLNNIIRHAKANNTWIKINCEKKRLLLEIRDDGIGFDQKAKRAGVGLKNITSRAELHNGKMTLTTAPGKGCTVSVNFELD